MKRCAATCKSTGKRCKNKTETKFCATHKRKSSTTKRKTVKRKTTTKRKTVKRKSTTKSGSKRRQRGGA